MKELTNDKNNTSNIRCYFSFFNVDYMRVCIDAFIFVHYSMEYLYSYIQRIKKEFDK